MSNNSHQQKDESKQSPGNGQTAFNTYTYWGKIYALCFLLGGWLTYLEMGLYENTLIPLYIPLLMWVGCGLLATPFLYKFVNEKVITDKHSLFVIVLAQVVANMCFFGGIVTYVFMFINFTFCKPQTVTKNSSIIGYTFNRRTSSSYLGRRGGYAEIMVDGMDKQILFTSETIIEKCKSVQLTMSKGKLGFYVIKDKIWLQ